MKLCVAGLFSFLGMASQGFAVDVPVITGEPSDSVLGSGETATLTVAAVGDAPLAYQWYAGESGDTSAPIADATNNFFTTPPVLEDATYWVRSTNANGEADSRSARVRIGFEVYTLEDLQKIGSGVDGWTMDAAYMLMNDIDASETALWNDDGTDETVLEGFAPIGNVFNEWYDPDLGDWAFEDENPFYGLFDGKGHVIRGLTVDRSAKHGVGLFGYIGNSGAVQNAGLVGGSMKGRREVGGLAGENNGRISQCYGAASVSGTGTVGGLVGFNSGAGEVVSCYAAGSATGDENVGGLIGNNAGIVENCYASVRVPDGGGLIGYNWGTVLGSCWDAEYSGQDGSEGGEDKTSEAMRQQATFVGWDFAKTWGIQEGEGSPYLRQFAEGKTCHETAPATVYPVNFSFVWSLRPAMTASVALAECDYVNARWQIATDAEFSDARDWMGVGADGTPLRTPLSCRVPVAGALNYGTLYYWRVRVLTGYGMWSGWSTPAMFLVWKVDALASGRDELGVWGEGLLASLWRPDYLSGAHDDFTAAIQKSGTNYEARIYRAATTLLKLSENDELRGLLADFGYTFDESLFTVTGVFAEAASPLPNEVADRIAAETLPALDAAAADLAVIPANWTGTVALSPADFPIDEAVYLDIGDVFYARAVLGGARAAVETAQAYDLTLDYGKTNVFLADPVSPMLDVTLDGDESEWTNTPAVLFGPKCQLEYVKIARSATQVFVLARLAEGVTAQYFSCDLETSATSQWFGFDGLQEGTFNSDYNHLATLFYQGNVIEMAYDIPAEEQGEAFHLSDVSIQYPNPLPDSAPMLSVTQDGDASEWSGVPVALRGHGYMIDTVQISRSATHVQVLVTLESAFTFDLLEYFSFDFKLPSGDGFSFNLYSDGATYAYQGSVLEASFPIPETYVSDPFFAIYADVQLSSAGSLSGRPLAYDRSLQDDVSLESCEPDPGCSDSVWFDETGWDGASSEKKMQPFNQFLADHPACLKTVRNPAKLPSAKAVLRDALALASAADAAVTNRTDGLMHFFEYEPGRTNEQAEARQRLYEAQASMDAPQHVAYGEREADIHLGAFFDAPFVTRALLPRLTDGDELVVGTFPDPTFNGILPNMTQTSWQDELLGVIPLVKEGAFTMDGQTFTTGGYAFWDTVAEIGGHTNVAQSGMITNARPTWVETTLTGPGTLTFSWAVSSKERWNFLSVYVDGVRQLGSISGECDWGPRQIVLSAGTHTVRWSYVKNDEESAGMDAGGLDQLAWTSGGGSSSVTSTPVPVPYAWLDGFSGLVQEGHYDDAAFADQDHDGKKTWEEYVAGTVPTNSASVFLATITSGAPGLEIGWTPDLAPARVYTVEGKSALTDPEWGPTNAASRFFRVKVQLP